MTLGGPWMLRVAFKKSAISATTERCHHWLGGGSIVGGEVPGLAIVLT